jgi:hypothetical protein
MICPTCNTNHAHENLGECWTCYFIGCPLPIDPLDWETDEPFDEPFIVYPDMGYENDGSEFFG